MKQRLYQLIYPNKCVFCRRVLSKTETDLCRTCRENVPEYPAGKIKLSFLAQWTGLWYYKGNVRESIIRYKFRGCRSYAGFYGRAMAMALLDNKKMEFDILSWVPISRLRKLRRGFDQSRLVAQAVAAELGTEAVATLRKVRNTQPQSSLSIAAHRRANVLGAYEAVDPEQFRGKRVLLIDDILTTGATASECAKTLLAAGAAEVKLATLAVASHDNKSR